MRMRTASVATLCLFVLSCTVLSGAEQKSPKTSSVTDATHRSGPSPEDLLQRSYYEGRIFAPEERCFQLFRLGTAAGKINSSRARAMTRSWSRELFRSALVLPQSWNKAAFQKNSLEALAIVDPLAAFQLLPKVDAPETGGPNEPAEDLRASAAQKIFPLFWDLKGKPGLEAIKSEARAIGAGGEYPYIAMGQISTKLANQKDTTDVQIIFREALDFYDTGPRVRSANKEFIYYLESDWEYLPASLREEALRVVVGHLTRKEERNADPAIMHVHRVTTDKGTLSFHDEGIGLLNGLLPKIRELDPDWAKGLEDEHPELKQPAAGAKVEYSSEATIINTTEATADQVNASVNDRLQAGILSRVRQQAADDPYRAAGLLSSLSNPEFQVEALASLAKGFANKDPQHAAELLASAQTATDKLPLDMSKLGALASIAEAAVALGDFPRVNEVTEEAFDLGEELLSEELDTHPGQTVFASETFEELSGLTRLAAQVSLPSTMLRLDHLKNETLRAYLLIAAAEGMQQKKDAPTAPH